MLRATASIALTSGLWVVGSGPGKKMLKLAATHEEATVPVGYSPLARVDFSVAPGRTSSAGDRGLWNCKGELITKTA